MSHCTSRQTYINVMTQEASLSEMLEPICQTTWYCIPERHNLQVFFFLQCICHSVKLRSEPTTYPTYKRSATHYTSWSSHSSVANDSSLLDVMWRCVTGRVVPDVSKDQSACIFRGKHCKKLLYPEDDGTMILQNISRNYSPNDISQMASIFNYHEVFTDFLGLFRRTLKYYHSHPVPSINASSCHLELQHQISETLSSYSKFNNYN
jgi:hypothetical protein